MVNFLEKYHLKFILFVTYMASVTGLMITLGIGITPDRYFLVLLIGSFLIHRSKQFIWDFLPFISVLIFYDFLRGFADNLNPAVHYLGVINLTKWIFHNQIPTVYLQRRFYHPGHLSWYDFGASFLYMLHFGVTLAFAFGLWFYSRKHFKEFMLALVLLSYAALITYLIFPVSPPWFATVHGYLPGVTKVFNIVSSKFSSGFNPPTIYLTFSPNLVAAFPSMHASYPFIIMLFSVRYFGWKGLIWLPYVLGMWVSIVYLGEHYFVDIAAAVIYCLVFFGLSILLNKKLFQTHA